MLILVVIFLLFSFENAIGMQIVRVTGSDGYDYINTELINKTDARWDTRKLIMCTKCTLDSGTIVAFQAYFRNAIAVKPLQFSVWAPDIQGMDLLSTESTTKIYTMLLNIEYDPSSLGRSNSVGCNNGIHTIIIPPGKMRTVNSTALIGVIVQPMSSIVYNFNSNPEETGLKDQLRAYDNLFDNTRLSPGESRQFGNLAIMEEISFGAITYPVPDLPLSEQTRIANDLAKAKNCSGGQSPTTPPPLGSTTPTPGTVTIDEIERGKAPPPRDGGWNLGNDASCMGPNAIAIRNLLPEVIQEPQMKIFIFAALNLPTGTVNGFQVCVGREVRYSGEGFRFQVWRRVDAKYATDSGAMTQSGVFFRLVGQTQKYQPKTKSSYTYLLEAKNRFNVSEGDYFGFVNYGNETLVASTPASKGEISAAIAFYELSNVQQALLIGESYKFDEALQFTRYGASILVNTSTTDPMARTPFDGPTGHPGPAGPVGEMGPIGPKGDKGGQGVKGPKGDQGPRGPAGPIIGPKGDTGPAGPPGVDNTVKGGKGPQGRNGTKGDRGDRGDPGKPGSPGKKGEDGTVGPRGDRGAIGMASNEAVNITGCPDGSNLTCPTSNGECQVINRYSVIRSVETFANKSQPFTLPTTFHSSETTCRCKPGFEIYSGHCTNVNECSIANGGCEFNCTDTIGSYQCSCPNGMKLANDLHRCDDFDECQVNPCETGDICLNRYGATEALCLHKTDSGTAGPQKQPPHDMPVAGSNSDFVWSRNLYIGLLAWLSGLSAVLIVCIVLLAVFWQKMGVRDEDSGSLKSYDLPSRIDPKGAGGVSANHLPEWATEMKEETYMRHEGDTVIDQGVAEQQGARY